MSSIGINIEAKGDKIVATVTDHNTGRIKTFTEDFDTGMEGLGGYNMADMNACRGRVTEKAKAYAEGLEAGGA